jgi:hypothetical protein
MTLVGESFMQQPRPLDWDVVLGEDWTVAMTAYVCCLLVCLFVCFCWKLFCSDAFELWMLFELFDFLFDF